VVDLVVSVAEMVEFLCAYEALDLTALFEEEVPYQIQTEMRLVRLSR
jgi:hypothetical protein